MKLNKILTIAFTTMLFISCGPKRQDMAIYPDGSHHITVEKNHWTYYYSSGKLFAEADFDENTPLGTNWKFYSQSGEDYFKVAYDSLRVMELGQMQTPATIFLYTKQNTIAEYQFFSDGSLRSLGELINGQREGQWSFYHPNGQLQTETTFHNGVEDGVYIVYRENGIPYYRGQYSNGNRAGIWEIYDEQANLVTTKNYDRP